MRETRDGDLNTKPPPADRTDPTAAFHPDWVESEEGVTVP